MPARALLITLFLILLHFTQAEADHNGDTFPISRSLFTQMLEMEQTGVWTWSYREDCANGNILPDIAGAFDDTSARYGVYFQPTLDGRQRNISTCAAAFVASCGAGAVACVGSDSPGYPRNGDAKYNGPYMATFYSFDSRKSVPKHEWMHVSSRRAEGYKDSGGELTCIPSDTIMGCGPQSPKDYTAHDDRAWALEHYPPFLSRFGMGRNAGGRYVYGCSFAENVSRLSVLYREGNEPVYWSGIIVELRPDANGCQGIFIEERAGRCYLLKQENALSWQFDQNEVMVGCSS